MKQLVALALLLLLACQTAPEVITVGVVGPLSEEFGSSVVRGIELAKRELMLPDVAVVYVDVPCNTTSDKLARLESAQAIIDLCSERSLSLQHNPTIVRLASTQLTPAFIESYSAEYGVAPDESAAQGYAAFEKVVLAVRGSDEI